MGASILTKYFDDRELGFQMVRVSRDRRDETPGRVGLSPVPDDMPRGYAAMQSGNEIADGGKVLIWVTHNSASCAPVDTYPPFRKPATFRPLSRLRP